MTNIIFYMFLLTTINMLQSSQSVDRYSPHFYRLPYTVSDVTIVNPNNLDPRTAVTGEVVATYGTYESENPYARLSPETNRQDSYLVPPSPLTPRYISSSEQNCRQVTKIFLGVCGVITIIGATIYGYTQTHHH